MCGVRSARAFLAYVRKPEAAATVAALIARAGLLVSKLARVYRPRARGCVEIRGKGSLP